VRGLTLTFIEQGVSFTWVVAVGMIMAAHPVPEATARSTLSDVAAHAGVTTGQVADILLEARLL
jgi:hypothetical protein